MFIIIFEISIVNLTLWTREGRTPMTQFFHYSQHPMTPFLKLQRKISNCALRVHFEKFLNFQLQMANFYSNLTQFTRNDPYFWKFIPKKKEPNWGIPHLMTPFFYEILHQNAPVFVFW